MAQTDIAGITHAQTHQPSLLARNGKGIMDASRKTKNSDIMMLRDSRSFDQAQISKIGSAQAEVDEALEVGGTGKHVKKAGAADPVAVTQQEREVSGERGRVAGDVEDAAQAAG